MAEAVLIFTLVAVRVLLTIVLMLITAPMALEAIAELIDTWSDLKDRFRKDEDK